MAFLKFRSDKIFTGFEMLSGNNVLVTNHEGIIHDIIPAADAGDDIQTYKGILTPGFVNCHCHLELSHMKGLIPKQTGLVDFVFKVVTQRHFAVEEIEQAIINAENEMLTNGIVAVGDICNNLTTLAQKQKQNLYYHNFIEASGWLPAVAQTRFEKSKLMYDAFRETQTATSIVPHAPYSVSQNLWQQLQPYFTGNIVTIHNQETAFEDEFFTSAGGDFIRMYELMKMDNSFFTATGKTSLQSYFRWLQQAASILLVHNTFTTMEDVTFAKDRAKENQQLLNWCICINANQYIENALPPIEMLRQQQCNIVLGTDSLASNNSLNILDELKTIRQNFPSVQLPEMLGWATLNGAKALNIQSKFGSLQHHTKPGVVLIDNIIDDQLTDRSTATRLI